ncbi:cell-cycle sustaining, positive selection, domain-containing protein [Phthorimaea operculella]|nr:cell-cycle sustaining, positive selection, domain-containing protein [Phthorimaea operculella]
MAATDGQVVVAAARWSDEGHYLREFAPKQRLPTVAKIIKGQYGGLGVPTLPSPGLQSTALLVSAGKKKKIIAQAIKLKEGRRMVSIGPRIAIPDSYTGYFELLSEEGRAVRCIESVSELARRKLDDGCLVREPIRVICAKTDLDGNITADGARNLPAGEVIMPRGEAFLGKNKYLKCTDTKGDTILLSLDQRGKFSAIAKEENISGVHTAKTLLTKRLPITVRLVHGTPPRGLKSASHFVPELRLLSMFEEEHVFALPLQKEGNALVALPLAAPLKMQKCKNEDHIKNFMEFSRLVEKCNRLLIDVVDRIHVLDGKLGDPKRLLSAPLHAPPLVKTGYFLRRSASSDTANQHKHLSRHNHIYSSHRDESSVPDEYDEIDQIYDYVRGFAPLPKNLKASYSNEPTPRHESAPSSPAPTPIHMPLITEIKPQPPPIETIPTKKSLNVPKAEKRTRKSTITPKEVPVTVYKEKCSIAPAAANLPKLYIKNSVNNNKSRMVFRQKSNSPTKEAPSPITSPVRPLKGDSPIFNIRYKSLSNIHQAMELDGTLDSSHSGGRTSEEGAHAVSLSLRLTAEHTRSSFEEEKTLRKEDENGFKINIIISYQATKFSV